MQDSDDWGDGTPFYLGTGSLASAAKFVLNTSGVLTLGTVTPDALYTLTPKLQVETTGSDAGLSAWRNENGAGGPYLFLGKSRGTAVNSDTIVQDDDALGSIMFMAADGVDRGNAAASIIAYIDGTPGENDTPGRIQFNTSADGSGSPTTGLIIDSSQNVSLKATGKLYLDGGSDTYIHEASSNTVQIVAGDAYTFHTGGLEIPATNKLYLDGGSETYIYESESDRLDLVVGGTIGLSMLESSSEVRSVFNYGTTAIYPAAGLGVRWVGANEFAATFWHNGNATTGVGVCVNCGTDDNSGTNTAMQFGDGDGSIMGTITFTGGTTSYNAFTAGHDASLPDGEETGYAYGTLVEIVEIYYKERKDGSEMERGILYKVQKSQSAYAKNVLGAYSGQYPESVVENDNMHQIYCLGDGHIICNGENGDIEVGDGICTSSTEGEGMKADKLSMIIGIAQEDTSFSSASETKLVPVQYGLKQFQPWE